MDVNAFNALKTYHTAQKALSPDAAQGFAKQKAAAAEESGDFNVADMAKDVAGAVAKSESAAAAYMTGKADPHSVVEAIASAELAVETAVTLRNKVVEAYQELLRMPV